MGGIICPPPVGVILRPPSSALVNPRPAEGRLNAPLRLIEESENTAAYSAAGFSPTWPFMFSATFVKISTQGQVKWPNYKKISNRATTTMF